MLPTNLIIPEKSQSIVGIDKAIVDITFVYLNKTANIGALQSKIVYREYKLA